MCVLDYSVKCVESADEVLRNDVALGCSWSVSVCLGVMVGVIDVS